MSQHSIPWRPIQHVTHSIRKEMLRISSSKEGGVFLRTPPLWWMSVCFSRPGVFCKSGYHYCPKNGCCHSYKHHQAPVESCCQFFYSQGNLHHPDEAIDLIRPSLSFCSDNHVTQGAYADELHLIGPNSALVVFSHPCHSFLFSFLHLPPTIQLVSLFNLCLS